MNNAMSLKAKIRNIAKQKNIPAQVILQNYMFERLLVRLAKSEYKDKFVLKGGMLVAAIVGLDNRATMDLDATLKNLPLTPEKIKIAFPIFPFPSYGFVPGRKRTMCSRKTGRPAEGFSKNCFATEKSMRQSGIKSP